jgi:RNA polymerase sigma-70 factor (ECF subfamily)
MGWRWPGLGDSAAPPGPYRAAVPVDDLDNLMTAAQGGDAEAYAELIERTQHLVRSTLLRDTADPDLADELAQEAYARAWAKREQYRPGTSPRAWLITIARSQLMEHHRRLDRDRRHLHELVRAELLRHRPADEGSHRADLLSALRTCLEGLGDEHRQLIELVHSEGLSSEDAGERMGIRADACRQRLSRLTRRLRQCAEERVGKQP